MITQAVYDLAIEIADSTTMSDIEIGCPTVGGDAKTGWLYDVSNPAEVDAPFIAQGVSYLEARGLLIRSRDNPNIVSFRKDRETLKAAA
ncbi:MAG TPA: hypothetical protein VGE22_06620 [Solimonas sp.]